MTTIRWGGWVKVKGTKKIEFITFIGKILSPVISVLIKYVTEYIINKFNLFN